MSSPPPNRPKPIHRRSSVRFAEGRRASNASELERHTPSPPSSSRRQSPRFVSPFSDPPGQSISSLDLQDLPYRLPEIGRRSMPDDEERRDSGDSDETLASQESSGKGKEPAYGYEESEADYKTHRYPPHRPRPRSTPSDPYYAQPPHSKRRSYQYPHDIASAYNPAPRPHQPGLISRIGSTLRSFTADPSSFHQPPPGMGSRRSSWTDGLGRAPNNFETTLAMNEDAEHTYLYEDDERFDQGPSTRERLAQALPHPGQDRNRRQSYAQRRKRKQHVIFHCAEPMEEYQKFTLTFAKALLAFGSPSHRIEAQLNSIAKVFQMEAQFLHTPGIVQVSFGNPESRTSETCLIKSPVGMALSRIHAVHNIYRAVIHDDMYASDGTRELRKLLQSPPRYGSTIRFVLSYITCFLICGIAFGGSLNDMWVSGVMGVVVRILQNIASKSELSASGSEVFTAAIVSFVARGFSSFYSQIWCFTAISSSAVISLLPGFLILAGSLDVAGRNASLGAPKIVSGIMTALYLGFGLTLGSDLFLFVDRPARRALAAATEAAQPTTTLLGSFTAFNGTTSSSPNSMAESFFGTFSFSPNAGSASPDASHIINGCYRDPNWGWYLQPIPYWALFIVVPLFAFFASMNNQQHWYSRQMIVMVAIACISFWITRLANMHWGLENHPDYVSLIGSFLVGLLGNSYSRRFGGTAFTCMLTGILLLVPDGLAAAGGLADNYSSTAGQDEYTQSLTLARKMISVVIGIMAGVYISAALVYVFGKKKNAALVTF